MSAKRSEVEIRQAYLDYRARCQQAFAPFAPVQLLDFFAGRKREVERLIDELGAPGRQVAIFGTRGVGKTSLARLADVFVNCVEENTHFARCTRSSTFDSVFADVLADAGAPLALNGLEAKETRSIKGSIGPGAFSRGKETRATYRSLSPPRVTPKLLLDHFRDRVGLIIVDEYDRVEDPETHTRVAELLKHFSDAASRTKLVIVGVADSVAQLIGEHESLTRCLATIRLDPMSDEDLRDVIRRGEERVSVLFKDDVKHSIVRLANGYPHYVHLVSLHAAQAAGKVLLSETGSQPVVATEEYQIGLRLAVDNAEAQLVEKYERAIVTVRRPSEKFELVLWAMALTGGSQIQVGEIATNAAFFTGKAYSNSAFNYHLGELIKEERGGVLTKVREGFYKFSNPLMRPYVRLRLELGNVLTPGSQLRFPFMQ